MQPPKTLSIIGELCTVPVIQSLLLILATIGLFGVQVGLWIAGSDKTCTHTALALLVLFALRTFARLPREFKEIQNADDPRPTHNVPEA